MMELKVERREEKDVVILNVFGRLDQGTVYDFQSAMAREVEKKNKKLVINYSGCEYISSFAIGICLKVQRELHAMKGDVYFSCLTHPIQQVLSTLELERTFRIFETDQEAVAAFNK